eukprot:582444-Pleurochrysis_carterae.AAC.2
MHTTYAHACILARTHRDIDQLHARCQCLYATTCARMTLSQLKAVAASRRVVKESARACRCESTWHDRRQW